MDYKISKLYTENLEISSFKNLLVDEKINLCIDFHTTVLKPNGKFIFKMYYSIDALENPIYLNWIGVAILETENSDVEINEKDILSNKKIKEFIVKSIENFSFFIGGKLPTFDEITGENYD